MSVESSPDDYASDLVDLGEVDIAELPWLRDSVLQRSLRRVREEPEPSHPVIAGFQSSF